jgi:hypothetical protein
MEKLTLLIGILFVILGIFCLFVINEPISYLFGFLGGGFIGNYFMGRYLNKNTKK